jgi:four helix bundle protein
LWLWERRFQIACSVPCHLQPAICIIPHRPAIDAPSGRRMRPHILRVSIRSYQDLRVWQAGMDLVFRIYRLTRSLPASERYGLVSQMRRAAVSIPANIAEGHGRHHLGDKLRYFSVANGSLKELETEVRIAKGLGYVTEAEAEAALSTTDQLGRMLACLTRSLRRRAASATTDNLPPTT